MLHHPTPAPTPTHQFRTMTLLSTRKTGQCQTERERNKAPTSCNGESCSLCSYIFSFAPHFHKHSLSQAPVVGHLVNASSLKAQHSRVEERLRTSESLVPDVNHLHANHHLIAANDGYSACKAKMPALHADYSRLCPIAKQTEKGKANRKSIPNFHHIASAVHCTWPSGISYERSHSLDDAAFFISASKSCRTVVCSANVRLPTMCARVHLRYIAQLLLDVTRDFLFCGSAEAVPTVIGRASASVQNETWHWRGGEQTAQKGVCTYTR